MEMYKKIILASALVGLTACGSSSNSNPSPEGNTPAVIAGISSAQLYTHQTGVSESLSITDPDAGEESFIVQYDKITIYGQFSISAQGLWLYELDSTNSEISALAVGQTLTDKITVSSIDGTTQIVTITIEGSDSEDTIVTVLPTDILTVPEVVCSQVFNSVSELEDNATDTMEAGTTLCLADGTYSDDLSIKFGGNGTESAPIKIAAQNPGKAVFQGGEISIKMGGTYAQLQGFVFEDIEHGSSLIETRWGTGDLCHDCRITELTVVNAKASAEYGILVHIYGKNVWLDHNIFSGKTAKNPMISFNRWVDSEWDEATKIAELAQGIIVYSNYIANRPPTDGKMYADNSDNDYEAIRTGLSDTHQYPGNSMVVGNLFENIQGEAEVISNKGSNNTISQNTVRNSYGSITNRHGNTNIINNNFILGDGYPYSGGLRIVDDGHVVTNNYIEGARYKASTHHGGIVILGSDGAGDSNNGYQQVENVHIAHNTVVDSVNSINIDGGGKSSQPKEVYFANNIVDKAVGPVFVQTDRGVSSDSSFAGNLVYGSTLADTDEVTQQELGATLDTAMLVKDNTGLYRPSTSSPSLEASSYEKASFEDVTYDMDGMLRSEVTEIGADEQGNKAPSSKPLEYTDVGPLSYSYEKPEAIMIEAVMTNADFENGTEGWVGADITEENAFAGNSLSIMGTSVVSQSSIALTANTKYAVSAFVKGAYSISVNAHQFSDEVSSSDYSYVVHEFTTGADETTATISLSLADEVVLDVGIADGDLSLFKSDGGQSDNWVTHEDSSAGLGDVGSSSDSAFTDNVNGSARVRFKESVSTHDFTAKPGLSQVISGVATNVDLTYSLYYCDKKGDDSLSTLHYGVKNIDGTIIAETRVHVNELDDAPEGSVKDCFKQVTLSIPNNTQSQLEIFALMEIDTSTMTEAEIYLSEQFTDDELEVRLDEFSLTYQGAPENGAKTYFDEVRLIKRVDQ